MGKQPALIIPAESAASADEMPQFRRACAIIMGDMENTTLNSVTMPSSYLSDIHWREKRPRALVVCCSDGRLQNSIDDFLHNQLGVDDYDRLYAPGGPAVLAESSLEYTHANVFRGDLEMLFRAHAIEQVILIFHGAAEDGPSDACCAHYRRVMPGQSNADMTRQQVSDMIEVKRYITAGFPKLDVQAYRAEVQADHRIHFLSIADASRS